MRLNRSENIPLNAANAIAELARKSLSDYLDQCGRLLYSSVETISPGDVYLLGLNPAGKSDNPKDSLKSDLKELPNRKENAYIDEAWERGNREYEKGEAPLQRRVKWLLEQLVGDAKKVCASNLVFLGSDNANGIDEQWIAKCWPVHERIIEIVKPKLIVAFGNSSISPYGYLKQRHVENEESIDSGHGNWKCRGFKTKIGDVQTFVAGLPHLSYYNVIGKSNVIEWLKQKLAT